MKITVTILYLWLLFGVILGFYYDIIWLLIASVVVGAVLFRDAKETFKD